MSGRRALATLLALALGACSGARTAPPLLEADLILVDGRVFTGDPATPWAEAVAIRGERVAALGSSASLRARAGTSAKVIAVGGRLVVPGINDAHTHLSPRPAGVELPGLAEDPAKDPSWREVLAAIRKAAPRAAKDQWIYGTIGARVLDDPAVDRRAIDAIAPRRPVLLACWTGHGVIASTAALRKLGIREDQPDPPGGFYVRRKGTRVLTGLAHEYAGFPLELGAGGPTPEDVVAAVRAYDEEARRLGITTIQMMTMGAWVHDPAPVLARAGARVRWRFMDFTRTPPEKWTPNVPVGDLHDDALVYRTGTKWVLDGTPVERMMWIQAPYADRPKSRGRPDFPGDGLRQALARALAVHEPLLLHAVGDAAIDAVFDAMDATGGPDAWRDERVRIEHGDMLSPDRFERARALGVVIVQNPSHFMIRDIMHKRLGPERTSRAQMVKSLLAAGIPLALGSDGPQSPWLNLLFATTHAVNPPEALSREEALVAYTRGSAYAEFTEHAKGTLAAGMLADLAVLSQDVLEVPADALPATTSVLTLVGGQIVYDAGVVRRLSRLPP